MKGRQNKKNDCICQRDNTKIIAGYSLTLDYIVGIVFQD